MWSICREINAFSRFEYYMFYFLYPFMPYLPTVCLSVYLSVYDSTALVDLGCFFSFLIYTQSVELLGPGNSPSQGRYLHTRNNTNTGKTHADIRASSGIRTHDPSVRAGEDSLCLRPGEKDMQHQEVGKSSGWTKLSPVRYHSLSGTFWWVANNVCTLTITCLSSFKIKRLKTQFREICSKMWSSVLGL
jgi:hypothetical protein